jgi:hypothetical protein
MPKHSPELIIDSPYVRGTGGGGGGGTGGGGGGGSTYTAGDGINIVSDVISVDVADLIASGAPLTLSAGNLDLLLRNPSGLVKDGTGLAVQPKSNEGLYIDGSGTAVLRDPAGAITSGVAGLSILKPTVSGLNLDATGLWIGAGDGIDVLNTTVAVDVTDFIDTARGLYEPTTNDIGVRLEANSGLTFGGAGGVTLGTPSTLSYASTNNVTSTAHAHAIDSSFDVGSVPAAAILRSDASGRFTTAQHTIYGNLVFTGGDRNINASNNLTLSPTTDLILDPAGLIVLPNAQELRTATIQDLPTGILGIRLWDRGSNYRQLTMGAGKFDELYVRVFVADEVRIDRGEEYWSKSYGIVESDFTMPADEGDVDVWFENSPGLAAANIFTVGDWLLARTIDWDTSLTIEKIWLQVVALVTAGSVDGYRQQWTIKRKNGGTTGTVVKKGNTLLDTGVVGQGWIHLSALQQDGGPFIQVGKMTSIVSDTPLFTNYARFGNLNGTVDYSSDAYGMAAGTVLAPSGIGATPSTGFSGFTVDGNAGLRLFNTELLMYQGSTITTKLDIDDGLVFAWDANLGDNWGRYVRWQDSLTTVSPNDHAHVGGYISGTDRILAMRIVRTTPKPVLLLETEKFGVGQSTLHLYHDHLEILTGLNGFAHMSTSGLLISETFSATGAASILHLHEDNSSTGTDAGVTIEQAGSGDARLNWLLITSGVTYSMGIDNSDSDAFKISRNATLGTTDIFGTSSSLTFIRAGGSGGLYLQDAATTTAIFIENGGQVAFGGSTAPDALVYISGHTTDLLHIHNTGSGATGADFSSFYFSNPNQVWSINVGAHGHPTYLDKFYIHNNTLATTIPMSITPSNNYIGFGTITPGVDIAGTWDWTPGNLVHIDATGEAGLLVRGSTKATIDLIDSGGSANARRFRIQEDGGYAYISHMDDAGSNMVFPAIILGTGGYGIGWNGVPINDAVSVMHSGGSYGGLTINNYGTAQAHLRLRRSVGGEGAESPPAAGSLLGTIMASGWTSGGWATVASGEIDFRATEDYNTGVSGKGGGEMLFFTRANGAGGVTERLKIGQDGTFTAATVYSQAVGATNRAMYVDNTGKIANLTSSLRFKTDIRPLPDVYGDHLFENLRPVIYKQKGESVDQLGFIAEEIDALGARELVSYEEDGIQPHSLHYERFIVPLVATVQRLMARISELEKRTN